jgi:hypothetical protein
MIKWLSYKIIICNVQLVTSHQTRLEGNWNFIWRCKLPSKVKNLVWRICSNYTLTKIRPIGQGVQCPSACAICDTEDGNSFYIYFHCHKSKQCWEWIDLWPKRLTNLFIIMPLWSILFMFTIMLYIGKDDQEIFCIMLWSLWKYRNNKVWNNVSERCQAIFCLYKGFRLYYIWLHILKLWLHIFPKD